jgi:hypothetical protein
VLRLIGFLLMVTIGAGGFLALDYNMARQLAGAEDEKPLTVRDYLGGLSGRIASVTGSAATPGVPSALSEMLPKPPDGWTVRPATAEDTAGFLPRDGGGEGKARDLILAMVNDKVDGAAEVVTLAYEKGDRRVLVKAVRYPDVIFTSDMATQQRYDLQMQPAQYRGISAMTVRGLDVTEDLLPDDMRGRLFMANVGGQIHLRVLSPRRMPDAELVTFFETLHVKALNAAVVDKIPGLGEVPVIVLASALSNADRDAYDAARAARATAKADESRDALAVAIAAVAADAGPEAPAAEEKPAAAVIQCESGAGGVKRCKVGE